MNIFDPKGTKAYHVHRRSRAYMYLTRDLCRPGISLSSSQMKNSCIASVPLFSAAAITGMTVGIDSLALGTQTCFNVSVETGTDMHLEIIHGDGHTSLYDVLDPISFSACYYHTYVNAGTYDVVVNLSNNRSQDNVTKTIDIDSTFDCNVTYVHSIFGVTDAEITLIAPGATRTSITIDFGDEQVIAEAYSNGVECFDPDVGRKTWNHTYNSLGIYDVEINMTNTQSSCHINGVIGVNDRIVDLAITNDDELTNLTEPTFFTQTLTAGSHIICERHYGDQIVEINYCEEPQNGTIFNHTYAEAGIYSIKMICYNYLNNTEITLTEYVQEPIANFTLNETGILTYGGSLDVGFSMSQGSNVSVLGVLNQDTNATTVYDFDSPVGSLTLTTYLAGVSDFHVVANNKVSRTEISTSIQIEIPVQLLTAKYEGQAMDSIYITPNDNAIFEVATGNGTFPKFTIDVGQNGSPVEYTASTLNGETVYTLDAVQYNEGYYTLNFTAENNVSRDTALVVIGSEYMVEDFDLTYVNVSDFTTAIDFTISDTSSTTPSSTSISFVYGDGNQEEVPLVSLASDYTHQHSYNGYGVYLVTVNVSNNVSFVAKDVVVQVGLYMENLDFSARACANTGDTVDFLVQTTQGSQRTYIFDCGDGVTGNVTHDETTTSYDSPYSHTFQHSYASPGVFSAQLVASSPLHTLPPLTDEVNIENPVDQVTLADVVPQVIATTTADFVFTANSAVPTNGICKFDYGDGQNGEVNMTFSGSTFTTSHNYITPNDYTVTINCSNCLTFQEYTTVASADHMIIGPTLTSSLPAQETGLNIDLTCQTSAGSRVTQYLFDGSVYEIQNVGDLGTHTYTKMYTIPQNVTFTCTANNTVASLDDVLVVPIQDIVQGITISLTVAASPAYDCIEADTATSFTVLHNGLPAPTDPHLSWTITDGQSSTKYSTDLEANGMDTVSITVTTAAIGNHSLTMTASNLVSSQSSDITFMVQKEITSVSVMINPTNVAVDVLSTFDLTIIGSHAEVTMDWGDGTSDTYFFDGLLDGSTPTVQHIFTSPSALLTVTASAYNCFTNPPVQGTIDLIVQERVNMSNMNFIYPNPLTNINKDITFSIEMKLGFDPPTDANCDITYTDLNGQSHTIISNDAVATWPWETPYTFPLDVIVEVQLYFSCNNLVSFDNYTEKLILEQPIENMTLHVPPVCETLIPCEFAINLTSGNNINYTIDFGDSTVVNELEIMALLTRPMSHVYTEEERCTIAVNGRNQISYGSASAVVELQNTVAGVAITFENNGYVDSTTGRLNIHFQASATAALPGVAYARIQATGLPIVTYPLNFLQDSRQTLSYVFPGISAYWLQVEVYNNISSKEEQTWVYVQDAVTDLSASSFKMVDGVLTMSSRFQWNIDEIHIQASISRGTNVTYQFVMLNEVVENQEGSTSYLPPSPITSCDVYAWNGLNSGNPSHTQVEFIVYMPVPLRSFEYNETTTINQTTSFLATMTDNMVAEEPNNICFRFQFTGTMGGYYFRGPSRSHCLNAALHPDQVVNDATFEKVIYQNGNELSIGFYFTVIEMTNFTVTVFNNDDSVTLNGVIDIQDIPCESPTIVPQPSAPGPNSSYPVFMRRSEDKLFIVSEFYNVTTYCLKTDEVHVTWHLYVTSGDGDSMEYVDINTICSDCDVTFLGQYIAANALEYTTYIFNMTITMGPYLQHSSWAPVYLNITQSPLMCTIDDLLMRQVGRGDNLEMQTICQDPDELYDAAQPQLQRYYWYCRKYEEDPIDVFGTPDIIELPDSTSPAPLPGSPGCFGTGPGYLVYYENSDRLVLDTSLMEDPSGGTNVYIFTVKVVIPVSTGSDRIATYDTEVQVTSGYPPDIQMECVQNCASKIDPTAVFARTASCENCAGSPVITWELTEERSGSVTFLNDEQGMVTFDAATGISKVIIEENYLLPGRWYQMTIRVRTNGMPEGETAFRFFINRAPFGGSCHSDPVAGEALMTFHILCEGWMDDGYSMDTDFTSVAPAEGENSDNVYFEYFYQVGDSNWITIVDGFGPLPQGVGLDHLVNIMVRVKDVFNTIKTFNFTVSVRPNTDPMALENALAGLTEVNANEFALDPISYLNTAVTVATSMITVTGTSETDASGTTVDVPVGATALRDESGNFLMDANGVIIVEQGSTVATDDNGIVLNADGSAVVLTSDEIVVTDANGQVVRDSYGNAIVAPIGTTVAVDDSGNALINSNGDPVIVYINQIVVINAVTNEYLTDANGDPIVAAAGSTTYIDPSTGGILVDSYGTPVVVGPDQIVITDPTNPGSVLLDSNGDPLLGDIGTVALTDPNTGELILDVLGNPIIVQDGDEAALVNGAVLEYSDGNPVVLAPGTDVVLHPTTGAVLRDVNGDPIVAPTGTIAFTDPDTGAILNDVNGNPVTGAAGSVLLTDINGVVYDAEGNPVIVGPGEEAFINPANSEVLRNSQGDPIVAPVGTLEILTDPTDPNGGVLTNNLGDPIVAEVGSTVLHQDGQVLTSADGNPIILDPGLQPVIDPNTGDIWLDTNGYPAVYDSSAGQPLTDANNNLIIGADGPVIVPNGSSVLFEPGTSNILYDGNGNPMVAVDGTQIVMNPDGSIARNDNGTPFTVPPGTQAATNEAGLIQYDANDNPRVHDQDGNYLATDPNTGAVLYNEDGNMITITADTQVQLDIRGAIMLDNNGNPVIVTTSGEIVATNPSSGDVILSSSGEPIILLEGMTVQTDPITGNVVLDDNGNPIIVDESGLIVETDSSGAIILPPVTTTPEPTEEERLRQEAQGEQVASILETISQVCSEPQPTEMAISIVDTCLVVAESMPALATDDSQLSIMSSAETLTVQLAGNDLESQQLMADDIINIITLGIINMDAYTWTPEPPTTEPPPEDLDNTPDDTANALEREREQEELYMQYTETQQTAAQTLNETLFSVGQAMASSVVGNEPSMVVTDSLVSTLMAGGENGADVAAGDSEINFPPTVTNGTQGQTVVYQVTNSQTNVFQWDSSANDVDGAIIVNAFDTNGERVVPESQEPMIVQMNNENTPTRIDFTNRTFNDDTGMLYAEMDVDAPDNAFMFEIVRPPALIPEYRFTMAILFNVTNTTDPDLGRPNLTSYDVLIELPGGELQEPITPAPTAPPILRRRKRATPPGEWDESWTILIPQEYVLPGKLILGLYIDNGTYPEIVANETFSHENRTVPDFDLNVMLVRCRTFDGMRWTSEYCKVSDTSTMGRTICECPPITDPEVEIQSYSSGSSGPAINPINFDYIFSNFWALFASSFICTITVSVIMFLYTVLAIYVRRRDKADVARWTVSPLIDNKPYCNYYYKISVYTGMRQGAGTKSTICFILSGEYADTGLRVLDDGQKKSFARSSVRHFVMSTRTSLGHLSFLRIWHNNSGRGEMASWFLDKVEIEDLQTTCRYFFLNGRWLAVDEEDGQVQRMLPVASEDEVVGFQHLFQSTARNKLTDEHLWVSVLSRPTRSNFTRLQRLTCCLVLLFSTMIANAMFYRDESEEGDEYDPVAFRIGTTFVVSRNTILTSIYSSLVVVPANMIIVALFRKSKPKYSWDLPQDIARRQTQRTVNEKQVRDILFPSDKSQLLKEQRGDEGTFEKKKPELPKEVEQPESPKPRKKKPMWKQKYPLPYWCTYVAWVLCFLCVAVSAGFIFLYGLEWGNAKSGRWLSALLLSFFQSVIIVQPFKVIIIAMIMSCIFKKLDSEDDDLDDEDQRRNAEPIAGEELLPEPTHDPKQRYFIPEPPDETVLRAARAKRDYDKMMWSIFKEIFFYFFFLCLICFIAWGTKDDMVYKMGAGIHNQFKPMPENRSALYVSDGTKFWNWAVETMIEALYNPRDYAGGFNTVRNRKYMSDQVSYKVGVPRMRQLRIKPHSCDVLRQFVGIISECREDYTISDEEDRHWTMGWEGILPDNYTEQNIESFDNVQRAYTYQSFWDLRGMPYWGKQALYNGGGYVAKLSSSPYDSRTIIEELRQKDWIDRYTRAVFIECTVFNPNTNLFAYINYLFEFPSMGSVMPLLRIQAFQVYANVGSWGNMVLAAQILYIFILVYFMYHEIKKVREVGCREYIEEPWNLYEIALIVTSIVGIAMFSLKIIFGQVLTDDLSVDTEAYTNYMSFAYYDECLSYVIGTIVFLANMKFLRLLRFNRHILFLSSTIRKAGVELICFSITFFVFFVAYGLMGTVIFGQQLKGFRTMLHTLESLYSMLLGKFDFNGIRQAQTILGPIFFVTFVLSVYFILVNMFLGILGIAFYEVRTDTSPRECDKVQFVSFTKEQAGYFSESLALSLKSVVSKEKDDDDGDTPKDRLVDSECIELQESSSESSRPGTSGSSGYGARPYLD